VQYVTMTVSIFSGRARSLASAILRDSPLIAGATSTVPIDRGQFHAFYWSTRTKSRWILL
jgi:hypothetical protein